MSDALYYTTHATPVGTLLLVGTARGLRQVRLAEDIPAQLAQWGGATELAGFFTRATAAIDAYFAGERLTLPYELEGGTPLQRAVWLELTRIPYGETISYSTLAERVGFPRAVRAVASACGANPLPLVIPCHRVVAKDGSLGGFSLGGVGVKETLLAVERRAARAAA